MIADDVAPPQAAATAQQSRGRIREPPGNTAQFSASANFGGHPLEVALPTTRVSSSSSGLLA